MSEEPVGVAAAGAGGPAGALAARPRLGFLGVGWIGRHRLEAVEAAGVAEVAAVADPAVPDALRSLEELLAEGLDGIVIATPSALHAEQAVAALRAGVPVFCQKPLGLAAAETRAVVDAAREAGLLLGVDLSYRHAIAVRRARAAIEAGEIGEVYAVELAFHNAYGPDKQWFYDPALAGGGCVVDLGTHLVDLALWCLGRPRVAHVEARLLHHGGHAVEDYAVALLDLAGGRAGAGPALAPGGAVASLACSWNLPAGRDAVIEAAFHGTSGAVAVHNVAGSFLDLRAELRHGTRARSLAEPPDAWGGRAVVEWATRLARGDGFDPEVEGVVEVAAALDAIYAAGRAAADDGDPLEDTA